MFVVCLCAKTQDIPQWHPNKQNLTFSELLQRLKQNTTWSNKIQNFEPTMYKNTSQINKIQKNWLEDPIAYRKQLEQIRMDSDTRLNRTFIPSNSNSTDPMLRLNGYLRMNCQFKRTPGKCIITQIKDDPQHASLNIVEFKFKTDDEEEFQSQIYQMQHRYRNPYKHWVVEQELEVEQELNQEMTYVMTQNGILKLIINENSFQISQDQNPEKIIQQAEKALKKTFFHQPDYLEAQLLYTDAAKIYAQQRDDQKAAKYFVESAKCALQTEQELSAAVQYKEAVTCLLRQQQKDIKQIEQLSLQSINYFQRAGKFIESARLYLQLANITDSNDSKNKYLQDAVDIFIQENKPSQAATTLYDQFCQAIQNEQYDLLGMYSEKLEQLYRKLNYNYKIDQMRLTLVIVCLKRQDLVTAEQQLNQFESFSSDEYKMAEDLINGIKDKNNDLFQQGLNNYGGKLGLSNEILKVLKEIDFDQVE